MKKQITNKELQDTLKQYDDNYIVQLSIGEEMDLAKHLFVDSDNGVIEISNFEDDKEGLPHIVDTLGNNVYKKDTVLFYYDGLKKGVITNISNIIAVDSVNQNKTYHVQYSIRYDHDGVTSYITFATEDNIGNTTNLVKFNW